MDYSFKIKMISDHLHTNFQKFEFGEIVYAHQGSIYLIKNFFKWKSFCNILNVFTATFDHFHESFLNN